MFQLSPWGEGWARRAALLPDQGSLLVGLGVAAASKNPIWKIAGFVSWLSPAGSNPHYKGRPLVLDEAYFILANMVTARFPWRPTPKGSHPKHVAP